MTFPCKLNVKYKPIAFRCLLVVPALATEQQDQRNGKKLPSPLCATCGEWPSLEADDVVVIIPGSMSIFIRRAVIQAIKDG